MNGIRKRRPGWIELSVALAAVVDSAVFRALNRARSEVTMRICFGSVLDDCWIVTEQPEEPEPVASWARERQEVQYRWPATACASPDGIMR